MRVVVIKEIGKVVTAVGHTTSKETFPVPKGSILLYCEDDSIREGQIVDIAKLKAEENTLLLNAAQAQADAEKESAERKLADAKALIAASKKPAKSDD
ncbi:MAG: hypothetical protein ACRD33_00140 [Candidatus Acidiferrales bacterium]